jgi:hypothetical protein
VVKANAENFEQRWDEFTKQRQSGKFRQGDKPRHINSYKEDILEYFGSPTAIISDSKATPFNIDSSNTAIEAHSGTDPSFATIKNAP